MTLKRLIILSIHQNPIKNMQKSKTYRPKINPQPNQNNAIIPKMTSQIPRYLTSLKVYLSALIKPNP
jgi:hypothetical protein